MDSFNEMRFMVLESEISILNEYSQDLLITESMKDKMKEIGKRIKEGFLNNKKIHPMCRHCNFYKLKR
jgi:hypothetical protein